jgi:hypothetical protein
MRTVTARSIAHLVERAVRGEITSKQVAETLVEKIEEAATAKARRSPAKAKSDQRLRNLCHLLQRERDPGKIGQIKERLSDEFYNGDQAPSCLE